ncbi:MAG TPA: low temperature requirement protein A [Solirubrobacteraceae bacterium]|nr:low temperature requirement protein A [Solirubrobacteraceae bacterium]
MDETAPDSLEEDRRTTPVELLWDLVFVFAITQVTTLLWRDLTWRGFGRAMLVLALVWWAWSAFVWAANAQVADSPTLRACLLISSIAIFITGLSVPHAFGSEAALFAVTYAVVRLLHLGLYADASRRGNASWAAIAGFAVTVIAGMALLIAGSFASSWLRTALWVLAAAIDYAGPAWLTRERLRGLQHVAVAHFAERYSLFVIICLGESIVAIGVGALGSSSERALTGELVVAVALGLLITIAMWWAYFEGFAARAEERLREHDDPVLAAADSYSYLHLVIVAGIITFAVGVKVLTRGSVSAPLPEPARLALCGGVAMYLVGHAAFALRMVGEVEYEKLAVAAALLVLFTLSAGLAAWIVAVAIAALVSGLCVVETESVRRALSRGRREASAVG